jgi:beta-glucanase (GH16 family)
VGHQYWGGIIATDPAIFHEYSIIWDSTKISWYMDGNIYYQLNIANNVNGTEEFQLPFYLILNLAVGGNWPGYPDQTTVFPAEMNIDYVRVYQPDSKASINELSGFSRLYPNPTNDELYLNSNSPVFSYTIFTLDGRILDAQHTSTPLEIIYTKQLSPGSYIITFEQNNKLIRQIIQKN